MKTICLFGDSLSKGVVLDEKNGRYTFLQNNFVKRFSDFMKNIKVLDFSRFGCTVSKAYSILDRHEKDVAMTDYSVLEFGGNDSDFDWKKISEDPDAEHSPKTPLSDFAETYVKMIEKTRSVNSAPVILNLPPIDEHRYFEWFSRGLNKDNILRWLGGSVEFVYRWHEMYNMEVCRISNEYNVPMIDIRSAFLCRRDYSSFLCNDGIHLNEKGHALVSDTIENSIPSLLKTVNAF